MFFFVKQKTAYEMRISDWSSACALPIWGLRSLPSAGGGNTRRNGLEVNTVKARKPAAIQACTASARAFSVAGRLRPNRATAAPKPASIRIQRTTEPSRSEEHTSELQSLTRNSYAVYCLRKKKLTNYRQ